METRTTSLDHLLVVKIGGGAGVDLAACAADLAQLAQSRPLVIVHGVSAAMNRLCEERGIPVRTLTSPTGHSSRYTDAATRDVFVEAAQQVSRALIGQLQTGQVNAVSVMTALHAERKEAVRAVVDGRIRIIRDDYSGSIQAADAAALHAALSQGAIPVLPPLAHSAAGYLNVDGDRAAACVAGALHAADLVILSNVRGLYRHFPDEASFVARVSRSQLEQAATWAQGRMKRKVLGAQEALAAGVRRVIIADGRQPQPVTHALAGAGTHFE